MKFQNFIKSIKAWLAPIIHRNIFAPNYYKDKKSIINWLNKHHIHNYTLIPDEKYGFSVDVNGDVDLSNKKLNHIPIKFNIINGYFSCSRNKLKNLEFCPYHVGGNYFNCSHNKLNSLEYCPTDVGSFYCHRNKLTSMKHCPSNISGHFNCSHNQLTSLEFCPKIVGKSFLCHHNKLTSLQGCPLHIGEDFECQNNELTRLEFFPEMIGGEFDLKDNPLLGKFQEITSLSSIKSILLKEKLSDNLPDNKPNSVKVKI